MVNKFSETILYVNYKELIGSIPTARTMYAHAEFVVEAKIQEGYLLSKTAGNYTYRK